MIGVKQDGRSKALWKEQSMNWVPKNDGKSKVWWEEQKMMGNNSSRLSDFLEGKYCSVEIWHQWNAEGSQQRLITVEGSIVCRKQSVRGNMPGSYYKKTQEITCIWEINCRVKQVGHGRYINNDSTDNGNNNNEHFLKTYCMLYLT